MYASVGFWDTGEWLISAWSLQVPHAPGAPLYSLLGRLGVLLFGGQAETAILAIHTLSAFSGACTVFFLILLGYEVSRYILSETGRGDIAGADLVSVLAGNLGGLMLAFSDTFWRNAVEAEVYALSACLFIAALYFLWTGFIYNNQRHYLLASLIMGLGLTVHPTNLLILPFWVLGGIFFLRQRYVLPFWTGGLIWAVVSLVLGYWLTSGAVGVCVQLDILTAGKMFFPGYVLPQGIGLLLGYGLIILVLTLLWCVRPQEGLLWGGLWLVHAGLGLYALIPLRSDAPLNLGGGKDAVSFREYYTREEFGGAPVLYGYYYSDDPSRSEQILYSWNHDRNTYSVFRDTARIGSSAPKIFPRMYNPDFGYEYRAWMDSTETGSKPSEDKPGLYANVRFFLEYQMGSQFFRYLGWNLIGRSNDSPESPVITGLGKVSDYPTIKLAPGQISLLMLPLLIVVAGWIGLLFISAEVFSIWLLWFLLTGPFLVLIINMTPGQMRERDYVFQLCLISCFFLSGQGLLAFCIWLREIRIQSHKVCAFVLYGIPLLMFVRTIPSHQYSHNQMAYYYGVHTLQSCPKNTVLFTAGDNDTFPLWCLQEIYGIRRDVSVINVNLLQRNWYLRQLNQPNALRQFAFKVKVPDSLYAFNQKGFYPEKSPEIQREILNHPLFRKSITPRIWMRYQYQIMRIIIQSLPQNTFRPVAFSPLIQENQVPGILAGTFSRGFVKLLHTDESGIPAKSDPDMKIIQAAVPVQVSALNYTERSYHRLMRRICMEEAQKYKGSPIASWILSHMNQVFPYDFRYDPTRIGDQYAQALFESGDTISALKIWSLAAYRSVGLQYWYAQNQWNSSLASECERFKTMEKNIGKNLPQLYFRKHWFQPEYTNPCQGN